MAVTEFRVWPRGRRPAAGARLRAHAAALEGARAFHEQRAAVGADRRGAADGAITIAVMKFAANVFIGKRKQRCLSMLEAISSESEITSFTCTRLSLMVLPVKDAHETILQTAVKLSPQSNRADVRQFQARHSGMMRPK